MDNNIYLYTGSPITPKFTLNIGGKMLDSDSDYDVEITDNVNVGTAHVRISGKGKFKGVIERTFEIRPVPAASLSYYADETEFTYTGEPCYMQVAVKFGETTLEEGKDYTLQYTDNTEPGTANAVITFHGNFVGVMSIPFVIYDPNAVSEPVFEEEVEPLENTSVLSSQSIRLGEGITVSASAEGGAAPYTYAVLYRKTAVKKWVTVQDFAENDTITVRPKKDTRYLIVVKVKDSRGAIAKQYFKINVEAAEA